MLFTEAQELPSIKRCWMGNVRQLMFAKGADIFQNGTPAPVPIQPNLLISQVDIHGW